MNKLYTELAKQRKFNEKLQEELNSLSEEIAKYKRWENLSFDNRYELISINETELVIKKVNTALQ